MPRKLRELNRKALFCTLALALNLPGLAAESGTPPASLDSAVEQAWRLHPQAAGLDARTAEARAGQELARGLAG